MVTQQMERTLTIQPKRVLYVLGGAGIIILIFSLIAQYLKLFPQTYHAYIQTYGDFIGDFILEFDISVRPGISVYYNLLLLNAAAGLLFIIAYLEKVNRAARRFYWSGLAWLILFYSFIKFAAIYEKYNLLFQGERIAGGWTEVIWIAITIVLPVSLLLRAWQNLEQPYKSLFLTCAVLFLAGNAGMEMLLTINLQKILKMLFIPLAQGLQYGGALLLIYCLLLYLTSKYPGIIISTHS